ncbi:ABC transporter substrate-binding protein [Microbacterium sp. YY-01]|uniref:ABC transporter substrate-binding protein n=1 Tax=Microbacterium sp. YY-01 TaxID=3421634 RepID=UPI003D17F72D
MGKFSKTVGTLALASLLLTGCSSPSNNGSNTNTTGDGASTLTMAVAGTPPMLDTVLTTYTPTGWMMRNVVEGLVTSDSNYNIQPMLAEDWTVSDDGLAITFTLRDGVTFHNGETMDADDVVASMQRWTDLSASGQSAIPGAVWSKDDDRTVTVTLQQRNPLLLLVMASGGNNVSAIYPAEIVEKYGSEPIDEFIGTGPYELAEYKPDEIVKLTRFADYANRSEAPDGLAGDRTPTYDEIEFVNVSDSQARLGGAITGQYDVSIVERDHFEQVDSDPNLAAVLNWSGSLYLNYNKKAGPLADVAVRQAANAALGSEEIMQAVTSSPDLYDIRAGIMLREQEGLWKSDADADSFNVDDSDLAQQMLADTGYADEPVRILAQQGDAGAKAAVVVQQQLERAGFTTDLSVIDSTSYLTTRDIPEDWEILVAGMNSKLEPAAMAYFTPQFAGWTDDSKLTSVINDYRDSVSLDEAAEKYGDILSAYADYRVASKVADWAEVLAVRNGLESAPIHDSQIVFWSVPLINE